MKGIIRVVRRVFFYTLFTLIIIVSAGLLSIWFYGDEIKATIISGFNESINTPIDVKSVDIDATTNFPFVTIRFTEVDIKESYKFSENSLLTAGSIECKLNPLNIIRSDYSIHSLIISDAEVHFLVNRRGEVNYQITKPSSGTSEDNTSFSINKFQFENVKMVWDHIQRKQHFELTAQMLETSLTKGEENIDIKFEGLIDIGELKFDNSVFLDGRSFWAKADLQYENSTGKISVNEGNLSVNKSDFLLDGFYNPSEGGAVDLTLNGKNTSIQNLISLLPTSVGQPLLLYRSSGDVYFDMRLKGKLNADEFPSIESNFGVQSAKLTYPKTGKQIVNTNFKGKYISESINDLRSAELSIKDFTGYFDEKKITGDLVISDFTDKRVKLKLNGSFEVPSLLGFIPQDLIIESAGFVDVDINFNGRIRDLEKLSTINRISSDGQLNLERVYLSLNGITQSLSDLNGSFLFNKNTIALQSFSGRFGKSDFLLDGVVSNILSYALMENQPLRLDASLKSNFIDIDELLAAREGDEVGEYSLSFSPLLDLKFNCDIGQIHFRRFSGEKLSGMLKIKDRLAMLQKIRFEEIGGKVQLEGLVDTKGKTVDILTRFTTEDIHIDSLFYLFDDFSQDFLVQENLKGRVNSEVRAEMKFTSDLLFIPQSLIADMNLKISGGELNEFAPIQELSNYIPDDSLTYLRFSNLENEVHVENRKIYLPKMEIRSNVTNITVGGTYTFDHHLNFKIVAPIVHTRRIDRDEAFGAIEDDGSGIPNIHLLLTGTADNYIVSLDKAGMKNQLVTGLKDEVKELKDAFKKKRTEKKKKMVLDDEDFFDWDNHRD